MPRARINLSGVYILVEIICKCHNPRLNITHKLNCKMNNELIPFPILIAFMHRHPSKRLFNVDRNQIPEESQTKTNYFAGPAIYLTSRFFVNTRNMCICLNLDRRFVCI